MKKKTIVSFIVFLFVLSATVLPLIVLTVGADEVFYTVKLCEDGYFRGLGENKTVDDFIASYRNINEYDYILLDMDGNFIFGNDIVTTGSTLYRNIEETSSTIIINGDVNCNGTIDVADYTLTKIQLLGIGGDFSDAQLEAMDTNSDKKLTVTDYLRIKAYLSNPEAFDLNYNVVYVSAEGDEEIEEGGGGGGGGWSDGWD